MDFTVAMAVVGVVGSVAVMGVLFFRITSLMKTCESEK